MSTVVEPACDCGRVLANFQQGSILKVSELDIEDRSQFENAEYVFVISHDCDITADFSKEPCIEVLMFQILNEGEQDSNLIYGKSPRDIHLPVTLGEEKKYLKLSQLDKKSIDKQKNIGLSADSNFKIENKNLKLLQSWLSSRYKRHSFPEALANRLFKLQSKIEGSGKKTKKSNGIVALFINVDPWEELENGDPYDVQIIVVYESDISGADVNATNLQKEINCFLTQIRTEFPDTIYGEALIRSDAEFTLQDMRSYMEWRFEHLSFRGESMGSMLP